MGDEVSKKINLLLFGVIFLCLAQVVGFVYMRKKFDDSIAIIQSSQNVMDLRIDTIRALLAKSQNRPITASKP